MKPVPFLLALGTLLLACPAHAQWQTTTYTLKGGWSSIYLPGDVPQGDPGTIFPATVTEVWRWNPNPSQVQFTGSPLIPSAGTPEWSVWKRGFPQESTFTRLTGGSAYLVRSEGAASNSYTVAIRQAPVAPGSSWVRNGANLLGFPSLKTGNSYPTFGNYFSGFPAAIAANSKVFKYVGGDLGPANPVQVFSTATEVLDRTQAYWFSAEVVDNFYAPLDIRVSSGSTLDFGRTGGIKSVHVRNRGTAVVNLGIAPVSSETPPAGQEAIAAAVPITRRIFNASTQSWSESLITGTSAVSIPPQTTVEISFGIDRGAMAGAPDSRYASFLRFTDSGGLMDVVMPVSARKASLTGLWVGDIQLSAVGSKVTGSPGDSTPQKFPLRTILHVGEDSSIRLLSQVFLGELEATPGIAGLCTREALLKQDAKSTAQRLVAAHLPLDQVITGTGQVALPGVVTCNVTIPYNDPTNPFVHQYHPDHDNRDDRLQQLGAGVESYDITRSCAFTFTPSPPAGSAVTSGWGSTVIGGTYTETISGVHRDPITVSGTFELIRASEAGSLSQ